METDAVLRSKPEDYDEPKGAIIATVRRLALEGYKFWDVKKAMEDAYWELFSKTNVQETLDLFSEYFDDPYFARCEEE